MSKYNEQRTTRQAKELEKKLAKLEKQSEELKVEASKLSSKMEKLISDDIDKMKKKEKRRSIEILGIFAKHNFYANGFTPVELRTTLEDLGPTYVKIGQIMSSRVDLLPEEYCDELQKLRQNVQPLDAAVARAVVEQESGKSIDELFSEFNDVPLGSASVGQVHSATLKDGTEVVVKVQRPLIADMMRKDFVLLKKMAGLVNMVSEGEDDSNMIDLLSVIEELEAVTEEELDFRVEARNTNTFRELCLPDESVVTCPTIIDELTTRQMETMTKVKGYSIGKKDRILADGLDVNELGTAIIDNYLHQVLDAGYFHGDPQQGNLMVKDGKICWIDFSMMGHITEADINLIQQLILAVLELDLEALVSGIMAMGAASPKTKRAKLIEDVDEFIERYSAVTDLSNLDTAAVLEDITNIASDNYITLPGSYTMLVRSLATIEGVLEELCPDLKLFEMLSEKLMARVKKSFDIQQELVAAGKDALALGKKATKIPMLASDALKSVVKGKTKINLELTGYEDLLNETNKMVQYAIFAIFACVLFFGSCILCMTNIQPQTAFGMPLLAVVGFLFSISLGIYTVMQMSKKK